MCLKSYFEHRLGLMAPQETLVLTQDQLRWILAQHAEAECACGAATTATSGTGTSDSRSVPALFAVADLATEFRTAESSMRALVANGLFGPAEAFRVEAEEGSKRKMPYRVPSGLVDIVRELVQAGYKPGTFCLIPQFGSRPCHEAATRLEGEQSTTAQAPTAPADTGTRVPVEATASERSARAATKPNASKAPPPAPRQAAPARQRRAADATDLGAWRQHVKKGG